MAALKKCQPSHCAAIPVVAEECLLSLIKPVLRHPLGEIGERFFGAFGGNVREQIKAVFDLRDISLGDDMISRIQPQKLGLPGRAHRSLLIQMLTARTLVKPMGLDLRRQRPAPESSGYLLHAAVKFMVGEEVAGSDAVLTIGKPGDARDQSAAASGLRRTTSWARKTDEFGSLPSLRRAANEAVVWARSRFADRLPRHDESPTRSGNCRNGGCSGGNSVIVGEKAVGPSQACWRSLC